MGLASKSVTVASAVAGLALFSQAPEFAQQYRQRLGGAVEELRIVVGDFDRDARASSLTQQSALQQLLSSHTRFARDRGLSMGRTIARYDALAEQQSLMENAHPLARPLLVLRQPDREVLRGAWRDFEPAVPLTAAGAAYAGAGALLLALLGRLGMGSWRMVRRRTARPGSTPRDVIISEVQPRAGEKGSQ